MLVQPAAAVGHWAVLADLAGPVDFPYGTYYVFLVFLDTKNDDESFLVKSWKEYKDIKGFDANA